MNKPNIEDVKAVRMLVRLRADYQAMRKRVDNRIGRKADGTKQDVEERPFRPEDIEIFLSVADVARKQEEEIQKNLKKVLTRFPIYTEYLQHIKGIGEIAAGWIVGEYNIHKASNASKLWQFTGLNSSMVKGKKRIEGDGGNIKYIETGEMIPGDKKTPGFCRPYNADLRTAMVGVLADGFIKQQNEYCMKFYYPRKERMANSENMTEERGKKIMWKDATPGHRDRDAKRVMIKKFLQDLYAAWREIEGLEVKAPYQESYLGHVHGK